MDKNVSDMCRLVTGFGGWQIGDIQVADGPHGIRAQKDGAKINDSYEATCFPTASSVACSWNRQLIQEIAKGIADEAKKLGVSVVLGPGINIKRSPMCGRNFEYYSEDPFLTGETASEYVSSMQENGVGACIKHFAGNSQETHRMTQNSMIDERALHEIYLAAFEKVIKKSKPAAVMASYNYINGVPACENPVLLTGILRKQWEYNGVVISDWGACVNLPASISAGMDVEMPQSDESHTEELIEALKHGEISEEKVKESIIRIEKLNDAYRQNIIEDSEEKRVPRRTRRLNHNLAQKAEEESAVLLKNENYLPLSESKEIIIIGNMASEPRIQGGGSSHINTGKVDSFIEQFEKYGVKVYFATGYKNATYKRNKKLENEAVNLVKNYKNAHIPVLFFGGLTDIAEGEGYDRDSFKLPDNQSVLLQKLLDVTDEIAFVSVSGSPYDMELPSRCKALLQLYLGGEAVAEACVRIILGLVNPSGKLAETIPFKETDVPCYGSFGKQADQKYHLDDVEYRESIFVGYRYYDSFDVPVRYCFGYGLSYTSFSYSDLEIESEKDNEYKITFYLENTGRFAGSEISELYIKNPDSKDFRAKRELRGFAKTFLKPGEKQKVEIKLDSRAFSVYQNSDFHIIGGGYEVQVGASLQDIRLTKNIEISGEHIKCPLNSETFVPLSDKDFDAIYNYPRTCFSILRPGEFTTRNSLIQLKKYSWRARFLLCIGRLYIRFRYFPKSSKDPEVRMMLEGFTEGNIDSICNQNKRLIKHKTIVNMIKSANKKAE